MASSPGGRVLLLRDPEASNAPGTADGGSPPPLQAVGDWAEAVHLLREQPFGQFVIDASAFAMVPGDCRHELEAPAADSYHHKLDALHRAGRELAALEPEQLESLDSAGRVELLKQNILRYARTLLNYEVVDIRLL